MKLLSAPIEIARGLFARPVPKAAPKRLAPVAQEYTLMLESGVVHINNVTGKHEGVTYSIMAEDANGNQKVLKRTINLAPYQTHSDKADGLRPVAAWSNN